MGRKDVVEIVIMLFNFEGEFFCGGGDDKIPQCSKEMFEQNIVFSKHFFFYFYSFNDSIHNTVTVLFLFVFTNYMQVYTRDPGGGVAICSVLQ